MMEIKIDLNKVTNKKDLLQIFGRALGYNDETYWGKNWDAFKDILGYLDTGGIYGRNEIISDHTTLIIENFHEFKIQMPKDFSILESEMKEKQKENPDFNYMFIE